MNNRMFSDGEVCPIISEAPILLEATNGAIRLSVLDDDGDIAAVEMTLEDIDDLYDALLLARAYLVNQHNQDTTPMNEKPCQR